MSKRLCCKNRASTRIRIRILTDVATYLARIHSDLEVKASLLGIRVLSTNQTSTNRNAAIAVITVATYIFKKYISIPFSCQ